MEAVRAAVCIRRMFRASTRYPFRAIVPRAQIATCVFPHSLESKRPTRGRLFDAQLLPSVSHLSSSEKLWVRIMILSQTIWKCRTLVSYVLFEVNFIQNATFSTKHRQKCLSASSGIVNLGYVDGWQWCEIQQISNRLLWKNWWIATFYH